MKRRIMLILLLLAGGAIVNVAVAWSASNLGDASWQMCAKLSDGGNVNKRWVGWPMNCIYTQRAIGPSAPFYAPPVFLGVAIEWRPIWPGFAINTVFYAAILWMLFAAPFALRLRRRIKRGLCVKCAYDLRGRAPASEVCPECGAACEEKS